METKNSHLAADLQNNLVIVIIVNWWDFHRIKSEWGIYIQ